MPIPRGRPQRSQSFKVERPQPEEEVLNINSIRMPGGFRRDYLRRVAESPDPGDRQHGWTFRISP